MKEKKEKYVEVTNIRQLRIGDIIHVKGHDILEMFVVGIFADAGTLGYQPADRTGMIYADFADNPGDVFEYDLSRDTLEMQVTEKEVING